MLGRIVEFFFPKVGELLVDCVHENITGLKFTLDSLKRNLKSLSAKASDVEDQIKNAELSGKRKRKREVDNWLAEVKSIEAEFLQLHNEIESQGFINKFMGGGQATKLNERVHGLIEQSRHFGELLLDMYETRGEILLTTRLVGKAFQENLERIWRLLVTEKVSSLGIHGMGGVGKTTLAKHTNNLLIEKTQECVFWVTVSQVFTIKKLQDEIAQVLGVDLSDEHNEDKKAAKLHRAFSLQKNSILILDDVWKNIDLEKVGFSFSMESHKLIITTRSLEVCHQIGCQEVIAVETLYTDEAWNLFSETLGKETKLALPVEEIAMSMTKLCGGLPLGIITLAGSMRGETAIHVWRNALEELKQYSVMGQNDMEDQVFKVLKYSFDRLNPNYKRQTQSINGYNSLQLCFLHCSLYPEDYKIGKSELIGKFISEELMDKRKSRRALIDQGCSILDKLVNGSLLESHGYKYVKMHDLVRAMTLKITEGRTMVIAGHRSLKEIPNEEEWTKDLEKISLMENDIREIPPQMSPNCPKLTTLLLQRNRFLRCLPDTFFSQMHGLCTLDLSATSIKKLPNSLSDLEGLKALLLEGCSGLEYVPCLGKLKALKELNLSGTSINEVPPGIEELLNLNFLSIDAKKLKAFPARLLLRFQHLQYLKFPYRIEAPIEEIVTLKELELFWGTMRNACDFNLFVASTRSPGRDHVFYNIHVGSKYGKYGLANRHLFLHHYNLKTREGKDETILGQDIQHLSIVDSNGLSNCFVDDFRRLNNPRSLKGLNITRCGGIECILMSEQLTELQSQFSTLESIDLFGLRDFKGVIHKREIEEATVAMEISPPPPTPPRQAAAFSSLGLLFIFKCHKMKQLGLPASEFPNIIRICVVDCDDMEEIIADADGEAGSSSFSFPKLIELRLWKLPKLKTICKGTMICTSIQKIMLGRCQRLKKLALDLVPPPPALEGIWIRKEETEWWESILEWEDRTHPHLLKPYLRFHEQLL